MILLNDYELICKILDFGLRAPVTPSTLWAPVTLVTVQTVSIQSADLGRLGLMLWSMDQTELDIVLMSLVLQGEIVSHHHSIPLRHTDPGELSPASMIRHRRSRSRSSSYDSVSPRRRSRSSSRLRGKKKSHKKRKHSSPSSSSSRRSSSHSSRERGRKQHKSKKKKKKHSKSRSSKHDKREKKHKRRRRLTPSPSSSSSYVSSDASSSPWRKSSQEEV